MIASKTTWSCKIEAESCIIEGCTSIRSNTPRCYCHDVFRIRPCQPEKLSRDNWTLFNEQSWFQTWTSPLQDRHRPSRSMQIPSEHWTISNCMASQDWMSLRSNLPSTHSVSYPLGQVRPSQLVRPLGWGISAHDCGIQALEFMHNNATTLDSGL